MVFILPVVKTIKKWSREGGGRGSRKVNENSTVIRARKFIKSSFKRESGVMAVSEDVINARLTAVRFRFP